MKNHHSLSGTVDKLYCQFAHAPADRLICLVKSAGSLWANDQDLKGQLKSTVTNCQTCKLYKKPPRKPAVGLPLATFQETAAMDLKFYPSKTILHMIDHATRLSAAVEVPSKHPK